ncbi:hypothetical protein V8E55_003211 [Tylopilus felleus]
MNISNPTQSITAKLITIKDIELRTRTQRKLPVARQFYVAFSVGEASHVTDSAKEARNRTSWDKVFYFDGNDGSDLLVQVYQRHYFRQDKEIGRITDTIGGILIKLKDGALEDVLCKHTSDKSDPSAITIRFACVAELRGHDSAEEHQATDAVTRAAEAINPLSSTPAAVGLVGSTVDIGPTVVTKVQTFNTTWGILLQRMELLNKIVANIAQIHPYTSLAWSVISAVNQVLIKQKNRDDRIIRLACMMSDAFAFVHEAEPLKAVERHMKIITLLIQQVTECGYFIAEYTKKNFWIRTAKYAITDIDTTIAGYENSLRNLKTALLEGVEVRTGVTVVRMMNVVEDIAETIELDKLPCAEGARFQWEKGCLPGTRETFLKEICDVLNNPDDDAPRVCLLTGVAGSGKSAVAHSVARLYDGQRRLGSSYCFAKTDVANRNPKNLFTTIARDLSYRDPQYRSALWQALKDDPVLRTSQSPMEQFERLIIEPSQQLHAIGPLVIVIDALDESGDPASRRHLLGAMSKQIAENALPPHLRFLITTRPETDILSELPPCPQIVRKQMGDIPDDDVNGDLEKLICHLLRNQYPELESLRPGQEWCRLLVHHSQKLFQWASTACSFIRGDDTAGLDIRARFEILVQPGNSEGVQPLDKLYQTVLQQQFTLDGARRCFRDVMTIVLALNEPLSISSLSALFRGHLSVRDVIKPLGSLLEGVLNEEKPIRPLHTSFRDFLLDEARSSVFYVDIQSQHPLSLGRALLACMRTMLRFNICDLKDSRIRNTAISDLPTRVNKAIPPHLAYSCCYWMDHLQHAKCTPDLSNEVTLFFKDMFPYWLEAISLLSLSSPLPTILSALETCTTLRKWTKDQETANLAEEAFQFIQVFAPVLRESTPHLYLSAMPQTPSSSPLCKL